MKTMRKRKPAKELSAKALLRRDLKALRQFEQDNPTDVAAWPNPFATLARKRKRA